MDNDNDNEEMVGASPTHKIDPKDRSNADHIKLEKTVDARVRRITEILASVDPDFEHDFPTAIAFARIAGMLTADNIAYSHRKSLESLEIDPDSAKATKLLRYVRRKGYEELLENFDASFEASSAICDEQGDIATQMAKAQEDTQPVPVFGCPKGGAQ